MNPMDYMGFGSVAWQGWSAGFLFILAWSLFWKGFALWHAAKRNEQWWFIAFLIVNTIGLLEIVYIFFIAKVPEFRSRLGLK